MRLLKIILAAVLAAVTVTGCSVFEKTADKTEEEVVQEKMERTLREDSSFTVFLTYNVTEQEKAGVRAWLERQPAVTEIVFEDGAAAYERFKTTWADDPDFVASVSADSLPETFRPKLTDYDAIRAMRDGAAGAELEVLPGVRQVDYQCTTVQECRERLRSASPGASR